MAIKNIVFDVGNVLVKWDPVAIIATTFPEIQDPFVFAQQIFKTGLWYDLNLGKVTEQQAIEKYHQAFHFEKQQFIQLMDIVKDSLVPVEGSIELVERLHQAKFPLYIITDNTQEIMLHLRKKYQFWHMFLGIVVSAEVGHLKPSPVIFKHLLNTYQLKAEETIFLDDIEVNVEGAKAVNMHALQFTTSAKCIEDLKDLNLRF